ncbi:MAG TPA: hypothetical protein DC006_03870 [Prevotellaceae bacterium]|nr:hypothetical protein [Prevotellaceae bacterium]HBE54873.1 hypothetical protein [Prevotellaceae bacterium]
MEKIQELTEKLYREGVERGQAEAANIKAGAEAEAQKILEAARQQAQAIEAQAKKKADELDANTRSELRLYASQAVNALKSEIANVLTGNTVDEAVKGLVSDPEFLPKFAVELASKWAGDGPVVLSTDQAESLKKYFAAKAKGLLDKGLTIRQVSGKDTLLAIAPADGSYKVEFGREEFEDYFKSFLRPQLVEMLF